MEFKTYGEIDLDETPIAVLGCGHFFTGETLDGLVGMGSVYTSDKFGDYNGLQELSGELTPIPTCPDCRIPIRQFATRRYNRVVNKAVLDETSKRFLVVGHERLDKLEKQVEEMEMRREHATSNEAKLLKKEAEKLRQEMEAEHQPTKKLFDAVVISQRREREQLTLEQGVQQLSVSQRTANLPAEFKPVYDQQVTLGAYRLQLHLQEIHLHRLLPSASRRGGSLVNRLVAPELTRFRQDCLELISEATKAHLPRLVIPTCVSYAKIVQLTGWYSRTIETTDRAATNAITPTVGGSTSRSVENKGKGEEDTTETARQLLADALALCDSFPGGADYRAEVEETMRLFEGPRYETVTPEEIVAIKSAMVSGRGGFATHSGHWYTCRNGHPVRESHSSSPVDTMILA